MSDDIIIQAARFLATQVEYSRHQPWADAFLRDIAACARVVRSVARGPVEQRYLGPCGAPIQVEVTALDRAEPEYLDGPPCDGSVYGRPGADAGRCRACGAEVNQAERRAWLDETVRQYTYTAREIADAYQLNVKTIRSWADRGHLAEHGHDRDGRPLYNLGDALDLAAKDAARRAEREAARERRNREGAAA